ncbi:TPA: superoxide dismutase family protein [Escherichia coli]|nr:superoxide dismutase family protein [Escherichia coli]
MLRSRKHVGPYNADSHIDDPPAVYVNNDGTARTSVLAPKIKSTKDISQRAIMIHKGGDKNSDSPSPLSEEDARITSGVINQHKNSSDKILHHSSLIFY